MTLKPIKAPKDALGTKAIERAVKNTLNAVAKGAQVDFKVTSRTWEHKPDFTIDESDPGKRVISTNDTIYGYVDKGTRPHIIMPRRGRVLSWMGTAYRAKTTPGQIKSVRGGNNNTIVYTKGPVQHPGTEARRFSIVIRDKWAKQMVIRMNSAIVAALKSWTVSG